MIWPASAHLLWNHWCRLNHWCWLHGCDSVIPHRFGNSTDSFVPNSYEYFISNLILSLQLPNYNRIKQETVSQSTEFSWAISYGAYSNVEADFNAGAGTTMESAPVPALLVSPPYRAEKKFWYVVLRNFFLLLHNFFAWPCLGAA